MLLVNYLLESLLDSTSLQVLELKSNQLNKLSPQVFADLFAGLSNLETLNLNRNRLGELSAGSLSGLRNLQNLDLAYNKLNRLSDERLGALFAGLSDLRTLDLRRNGLRELPAKCLPVSTSCRD